MRYECDITFLWMLHYTSLNNHYADINGNVDLCKNLEIEVILPIFNFLSI